MLGNLSCIIFEELLVKSQTINYDKLSSNLLLHHHILAAFLEKTSCYDEF